MLIYFMKKTFIYFLPNFSVFIKVFNIITLWFHQKHFVGNYGAKTESNIVST